MREKDETEPEETATELKPWCVQVVVRHHMKLVLKNHAVV